MQKQFWLERWRRDETAFHQADFNPSLVEYWPALRVPRNAEVFVPLCGKSRDMLWLRGCGHRVTGVELSKRAVDAFFSENGLSGKPALLGPASGGGLRALSGGGITLFCGDFFRLEKRQMRNVRAVYDRAALIALPPMMRRAYARHMAQVLPPGCQMLLLTIDYPQGEHAGPPFSVTFAEAKRLYSPYAELRLLERKDRLAGKTQHASYDRKLSMKHENVILAKFHA
jgi:thiopurine S-methyltransferase